MSARSPLEALRELRASEVEQTTERLATSLCRERDAARKLADAQAEVMRHAEQTRAVGAAERATATRAADLHALARYETARRAEAAELAERVASATSHLDAARQSVASARAALATARAEHDAVAKRLDEETRRRTAARLAREDESLEDQLAARRAT